MAVTVGFATGADAGYVIGPMGGGAQSVTGGHRGTEYYLRATEKGGEPPGKWIGEGLADLGIHDGDQITAADQELFEKIYGDFQDVRDPSGEATSAAAPRVRPAWRQAIYQRKLDAEPEATAERRREMMTEARAEVPRYDRPLLGHDFLAGQDDHAGACVRPGGGERGARRPATSRPLSLWESRAAGIWEEIEKAARLYIDHQQQESGYVRTGPPRRAGRRRRGRALRAGRRTSRSRYSRSTRAGTATRSCTCTSCGLTGSRPRATAQWRAIDSRALTRNKQEGAVKAAFALESALARRYGFSWAYREESKGRILAESRRRRSSAFSSRRAQISAEDARARAGVRAQLRARAGPARAGQHAPARDTMTTRKRKGEEKLDMDAKLREWGEDLRATQSSARCAILRADIWGTLGGQAQDAERGAGPGRCRARRRARHPDASRGTRGHGCRARAGCSSHARPGAGRSWCGQ